MKSTIIKRLSFAAIFTLLLFSSLAAQTDTIEKGANVNTTLPMLGKHKFIVNPYVRSPFIKTYIRNTLGFGQALDLQVPIIEIEGVPLSGLRGDLLFLQVEFEYQYAVNDWLAVFGDMSVFSRFGSGAQALIAQGINATVGFELGWMLKLLKTEKVMLSATLNIWNNSGTVINLYEFIQRIIDDSGLSDDNHLVITRNFIQGGGGLRFAWAATDFLGVNGLTEFAYGESVDKRNQNEIYYYLAGSVDFELNKVWSVPIGFAAGFKLDSFIAGSDNTIKNKITNLFLRTAYTGRNDFLISLDITWNRMPLSQLDQTLNGGTATVNFEYFF